MAIVEEEADESMYWMELLVESGAISADKVDALLCEANELLAITVSSIKTARMRMGRGAIHSALAGAVGSGAGASGGLASGG